MKIRLLAPLKGPTNIPLLSSLGALAAKTRHQRVASRQGQGRHMTMAAQAGRALSPNIQRPTASCPGPLNAGDISASRADGRQRDSAWNQQICGRRAFVLLLWVKDQLIAASDCSLGSNQLPSRAEHEWVPSPAESSASPCRNPSRPHDRLLVAMASVGRWI